jgi:hypothetical protein
VFWDQDSHVFAPPGSGSICQRYGSGSGSGTFYHQEKIVRKTLIPTVTSFGLFIFEVNVPSESNKQKNLFKTISFCWRLEGQ